MRWMKRQGGNRMYSVNKIKSELLKDAKEYAELAFDYINKNYIIDARSIRTGDLFVLNNKLLVDLYADLESRYDKFDLDLHIQENLEYLLNKISWIPLSVHFSVIGVGNGFFPTAITRVNDDFIKDLKRSCHSAIRDSNFVGYFSGAKPKCFTISYRSIELKDLVMFYEYADVLKEILRTVKEHSITDIFVLNAFADVPSILSEEYNHLPYENDLTEKYVFVGLKPHEKFSPTGGYVVISASINMGCGYNFTYVI